MSDVRNKDFGGLWILEDFQKIKNFQNCIKKKIWKFWKVLENTLYFLVVIFAPKVHFRNTDLEKECPLRLCVRVRPIRSPLAPCAG